MEQLLAHLVVIGLMEGNHEKGHVVVMDNYFISLIYLKNWQYMEHMLKVL